MSPAGSGRRPHPLSRGHDRSVLPIPRAARAVAERDPVGALRRSARSLTADRPAQVAARATIRPASIHWSAPRRELRDPRSFRAVPRLR
ncbi:MAG: hypothetical protein DRQ55_17815 [Planctomycetota bacterium]|nr:MAG: hypothetical protein DRQ55_17815 [Planctomycetota bacterium]